MALRPTKPLDFKTLSDQGKSYLALWRKYHSMLTSTPRRKAPDSVIVYQFQLGTPNKVFRRRWVRAHGTTAGLKDLPRYPMRVFSVRVKFLEDHIRACERTRQLLSKLYNRLSFRKGSEYLSPPVISSGFRVRKTFGQKPVAANIIRDGRESYLSVVGGETYTISREGNFKPSFYTRPPPIKKWDKYWYFYRTRGLWRVSEHHPYGDEGITGFHL